MVLDGTHTPQNARLCLSPWYHAQSASCIGFMGSGLNRGSPKDKWKSYLLELVHVNFSGKLGLCRCN